ncbi:hypothetical protein HOK51_08240 [Candidatus Woesearchaeota archaeon]|jgi:hypothetical protein|nr:hypothetical protein [Candidatus Woesearchaeota archaeon]MBT6519814.1 hypothetical protein [Candidatus Woesearchaeota archaeon]MBT7368193.1 hypothetical protein [Candidatus Woesearchaeota archaeon]
MANSIESLLDKIEECKSDFYKRTIELHLCKRLRNYVADNCNIFISNMDGRKGNLYYCEDGFNLVYSRQSNQYRTNNQEKFALEVEENCLVVKEGIAKKELLTFCSNLTVSTIETNIANYLRKNNLYAAKHSNRRY